MDEQFDNRMSCVWRVRFHFICRASAVKENPITQPVWICEARATG